MKRVFRLAGTIICILACAYPSFSLAQTTFERKYSKPGFECGAGSVHQTADGGYIVAGWIEPLGASGAKMYLMKTDSHGDTLWTQSYSGLANSIEQTLDGGYIIAGSTLSASNSEDVYLIKTDSLGDTLWTRTYGGWSVDFGCSVHQTSDGGYIIAGSTLSYGAGLQDVYLIKTNSEGGILWTRTYGTRDYDNAVSVQQTSDGGYIFAGGVSATINGAGSVYLVKTDSSGDTLWTRRYGSAGYAAGANSVQQTSDGGYILSAFDSLVMYSGSVLKLIKTNPSGDTLWTRTYGHNSGNQVCETSDGGYIVAGTYQPGPRAYWGSMYLMKTNSLGDSVWTRTYGSSSGAYSVEQTRDGGYIVAGYADAYSATGYKVYLIKTQADGLTDVQNKEGAVPTVFTLLQNYPNPFNPSTAINYQLPMISQVTLKVYDVLGREVATLVNEKQTPGTYAVQFDGTKLGSGVYFYRLQVGSLTQTRKMLLVK